MRASLNAGGTNDDQQRSARRRLLGAVLHYVAVRRQLKEITGTTAECDRSELCRFAQVIGPDLPVARLTRQHIEKWITSRDVSAGTLRGEFSAVKGFCAWAVQNGWLKRNPCDGIRGPRVPRSVPRSLPSASVSRVLAECPDQRARAIVSLMVQEALRRAEVARLQLGDVDFDDRVLRVCGKGGHERFVPLSAGTYNEISRYLDESPTPGGPLFRSYRHPTRGLSPDWVGELVSDIMKLAGVKERPRDGVSAHALRHSSASHMLAHGADVEDVRQILGHERLSSTAIYLKRTAALGRLRDAVGGRDY